jgi:hypothetical protein
MPQSQANPQPFDPPLTGISLQTARKAIHVIDVSPRRRKGNF